VSKPAARILVLAARQPAFCELLEDAGFEVDVHTRPLGDPEKVDADLAVVFRGRLLGRTQAAALVAVGIPVVEVMNVEPPSVSTRDWIRVSNRITKTDLVQIVHAVADWAKTGPRATEEVAA